MNKFKLIIEGWTNTLIPDERVEDLAKQRAELCALCPNAKWSLMATLTLGKDNSVQEVAGMACERCGCPLPAKVRSPGSECPLDGEEKKWQSVNLNNLYMETRKIVQGMEDMSKTICRSLQIMRNAGAKNVELENLSTDTVNKLQGISERIFELQDVKHSYQKFDFAKGSRLHRNGGLPKMNKEKAIMSFNTELNGMKTILDTVKTANAFVLPANKLVKRDDKTTAMVVEVETNISKMKEMLSTILNEKEEVKTPAPKENVEVSNPMSTPTATPVSVVPIADPNLNGQPAAEEEKKSE